MLRRRRDASVPTSDDSRTVPDGFLRRRGSSASAAPLVFDRSFLASPGARSPDRRTEIPPVGAVRVGGVGRAMEGRGDILEGAMPRARACTRGGQAGRDAVVERRRIEAIEWHHRGGSEAAARGRDAVDGGPVGGAAPRAAAATGGAVEIDVPKGVPSSSVVVVFARAAGASAVVVLGGGVDDIRAAAVPRATSTGVRFWGGTKAFDDDADGSCGPIKRCAVIVVAFVFSTSVLSRSTKAPHGCPL